VQSTTQDALQALVHRLLRVGDGALATAIRDDLAGGANS